MINIKKDQSRAYPITTIFRFYNINKIMWNKKSLKNPKMWYQVFNSIFTFTCKYVMYCPC